MKTKVMKYMGDYSVQINHGNQYFYLEGRNERKDADWMKSMFDKMVSLYRDEVIKEFLKQL